MSITEACVAVAIISTTAAIAAPSLIHTRETYLLHSAARAVAGQMHAARISAITRNRDCRIVVPSASMLAIECQKSSWQRIDAMSLPVGMVLSANARPEFHRRGNVSPAGTLTVCNRFGRCLRVIVNVSGRVRIQ